MGKGQPLLQQRSHGVLGCGLRLQGLEKGAGEALTSLSSFPLRGQRGAGSCSTWVRDLGGAGPPASVSELLEADSASASRRPLQSTLVSATNVSLLTSYLLLLYSPRQTLPRAKAPREAPSPGLGDMPADTPGSEGFGRVGWGQTPGRRTERSEDSRAVLESGAGLGGMAGEARFAAGGAMGDRELWGDFGQGGVVQIGLEMSLGGEETRKKKRKVPGEPGCGQPGGPPEEGGRWARGEGGAEEARPCGGPHQAELGGKDAKSPLPLPAPRLALLRH